ncbi:YbhB/YbcL family Raf kinase inhibitor-like protein [Oryzibacter oryziterrae]|uniref:YbhB/YbcL family Raf kinase inhibitor-like protein n=1 Tax=Oryzibacter oryziterrae TaxID=2766474 RepID=UPI001F00F1B2|nr:YbhB/YbcL family Raf kinase inhibitor-like protein [Oryzibacter oryziterrae]
MRLSLSALTAVALMAGAGLAQAADFTLTSPDIAEGKVLSVAQVAHGFGCSGEGKSPALSWSGAPEGTKSFVVTAYDPDAPTGSGFWHWVMFNIPASVTSLPGGITPDAGAPAGAVQSKADAGYPAFVGACPPPGQTHRYIFTVTALKADKLDLDQNASGAMVGFMAGMNALGKASITATYGQ